MKYTKLFNNHSEYEAFTATTSFTLPNVSWCIEEREAHSTPLFVPCREVHIYALVGDPSYPSTVPATATSFSMTFGYSDTYTARTCEESAITTSTTVVVSISANPSYSARTISGSYEFHGISIPYELTQEGKAFVIAEPVITTDGEYITITCATEGASIYYQLDNIGEFALYDNPIVMTADTLVKSYSTLLGQTSTTVSEWCEYNQDYSKEYLTFDVLSGGTINWTAWNNVVYNISYSINNGEWTEIESTSSGTPITVNDGDKVRIKGSNERYATNKDNCSGFSGGTAYYNVEGNIMSLIGGDNFTGLTSFNSTQWVFHDLFAKSNVISAENLVLPVMELTPYCYRALFSKASSLVKAPELPATTLASYCYYYMFDETKLTEAPELPAQTLVTECYRGMFAQCRKLNYIKCLAENNVTTANCNSWVLNVAATGTFVKDANATWTTGNNGIPTNWTAIDEGAPSIPTISCDGFEIELDCRTPSADIYYQLDYSGSYTKYTAPISMTGDTFIECHSEKNGVSSNTTSQTCIYDDRTMYEYANQTVDTWKYNGRNVTVPNSVNAIDGHSGNYAKGEFVYETNVDLRGPETTYLWFQHADQSATIYIDDNKVEKHWGGYAPFFTDISSYVHKGTNNIKVELKNNEGNNLAPASGDFNFNATLGKVRLLTSPYIPAMKYGYDGFHITSTVSSASATINVATSVPVGATVICKISGDNCSYSASSASTGEEMVFTTTISNPHLWNGTIDPYLYNVTLEIYYNNELYHRFVRPYGFRFYRYAINETIDGQSYTGFLLNGEPYLLRGVCMHDDLANKANALNDADYTQEFNIIQELGCNFVRLAHYPHPKEVYDKCDQLGIIVETEAPCVNKLESTMPSVYYEHLEGQYNDMVNQHYNHPCIVFWGLSNEAKVDNSTFAKNKVETYTAQIKELDSERMVGLVGHALTDPSSYFGKPTNIDWIGSNLYEGWYQDAQANNLTSLVSSKLTTCLNNTVTRDGKAYAFSEYGCGGTSTCHSDDFMSTTTRGNNPRHDIEYMMWLHEGHIAAIKNKPELLFSSQWQLFDIAVWNRNEGYIECIDGIAEHATTNDNLKHLNNKGLVERDHVTKKDTFYLYKAWWNQTDEFVHICGKNYTKTSDRVIKCYTNETGTATLYVNGTSVATTTVTDYIAQFASQNFNSGDVIRVDVGTSSDTFTFA